VVELIRAAYRIAPEPLPREELILDIL